MSYPNAQARGFEVVSNRTQEVVHFVDCDGKSDRAMEKVESGLVGRIDLDHYHVREVGR